MDQKTSQPPTWLAESGTQPTDPLLPYGLPDGSNNNLIEAQTSGFGAADRVFPRMTDPVSRTAEAGTSFAQNTGDVIDSRPRTISNLIVDQTATNPAAVALDAGATPNDDGTLFIPNHAGRRRLRACRTAPADHRRLGDRRHQYRAHAQGQAQGGFCL